MKRQIKVHCLKTWPEHHEAVEDGSKTFELRRDDRGFEVGDLLQLRCWDPRDQEYVTSRPALVFAVSYVTRFPEALRPGFVCLGLREPTRQELHAGLFAVSVGNFTT